MNKKAFIVFCMNILSLDAVDGALDTTFNPTGGIPGIVTTLRDLDYQFSSIIVQADGKIVTAAYGYNPTNLLLARYTPSGSLDATFGTDGIVVGPTAGNKTGVVPPAIVIQPDGKIVIGFSDSSGSDARALVARYTVDGELDSSFGSGTGVVMLPNYGAYTTCYCGYLVMQPDGKILCIGGAQSQDFQHGYIVRLTKDGSTDSSFGSDGMYVRPEVEGSRGSYYFSGLLQHDGKVVIGGSCDDSNFTTGYLLVDRLLSTGIPDTDFGTQGETITQISDNDAITSLVLQSDGRIVASGSSEEFGIIVRYTSQGILDTSFGSPQGYVTNVIPVTNFSGCALQSDGKIVVAEDNGSNSGFKIARYFSDGSIDTTFGTDGIITTTALSVYSASGASIQPDGKLLIAGSVEPYNGIVIARYLVANTPLATTTITYPPSGQTFDTVPTFSGAAQNPSMMSIFINDTLNDADTVFTTSSYNQWTLTPTRSHARTGVFPPGTYTYYGVSYYPNGRSQQETQEGTFTIENGTEQLSKISLLSEQLLLKACSETRPATSDLAVALHNKVCDGSV